MGVAEETNTSATKSDFFVLLKRLGFVGLGFVFAPYKFCLCNSLRPLQGRWSNARTDFLE